MFGQYRVRLVDDARHAWKWSSMRFLALGTVVQGAVLTADRMGLSTHLPDWLLSACSSFAFFCIVAAGVGRITQVEKSDGSP